jgi:prepilin-type N-terminal cleavage/methylation domain-containing protein
MKRSANQFVRGDKRCSYRGFTLLELMIVISIMMILMAVQCPYISST